MKANKGTTAGNARETFFSSRERLSAAFVLKKVVGGIALVALFACAFFVVSAPWRTRDPNSLTIINPVKSVGSVQSKLAQLFPNPDADTKRVLDELAKSFQEKQYEAAVIGIQTLQTRVSLNFEQSRYLASLMTGMQRQVAEEAARGNPDAVRARAAFKRPH